MQKTSKETLKTPENFIRMHFGTFEKKSTFRFFDSGLHPLPHSPCSGDGGPDGQDPDNPQRGPLKNEKTPNVTEKQSRR